MLIEFWTIFLFTISDDEVVVVRHSIQSHWKVLRLFNEIHAHSTHTIAGMFTG